MFCTTEFLSHLPITLGAVRVEIGGVGWVKFIGGEKFSSETVFGPREGLCKILDRSDKYSGVRPQISQVGGNVYMYVPPLPTFGSLSPLL